jgi:hypothetical protein
MAAPRLVDGRLYLRWSWVWPIFIMHWYPRATARQRDALTSLLNSTSETPVAATAGVFSYQAALPRGALLSPNWVLWLWPRGTAAGHNHAPPGSQILEKGIQ